MNFCSTPDVCDKIISNSKTYCPLNLFAIVSELEELGKIIKIIIKKMTLIKDTEPNIPISKIQEVAKKANIFDQQGYNKSHILTLLLEDYDTEIVNAWRDQEQE